MSESTRQTIRYSVRWSSRDLCLKGLDKRYDILLQVLEKVIGDKSLEDKQRAVAVGLRQSFLKKEMVATACFFKEIFGITGPLNKYLQGINMDLGKANDLVYGAMSQLQKLRDEPDRVTNEVSNFKNTVWDTERMRSCRTRDGTGEDLWIRKMFYPVLDQMMSSLKRRFEHNKDILSAMSWFSPKRFKMLQDIRRSCWGHFCILQKLQYRSNWMCI